MQKLRTPKKEINPLLESGLSNRNGGIIADRCKTIYIAFQKHQIQFQDMKYALMQYQRMEVDSKKVHANHILPDKPRLPTKKDTNDTWNKYYKDQASYKRALNLNYNATMQIQNVTDYQFALQDDDHDYQVGKDWALYILDGQKTGAVDRYLNPKAHLEPQENKPLEELSLEELQTELAEAEEAPLPGRNIKLMMLKLAIKDKYKQLGTHEPVKEIEL